MRHHIFIFQTIVLKFDTFFVSFFQQTGEIARQALASNVFQIPIIPSLAK
jgi:hypothetical protein